MEALGGTGSGLRLRTADVAPRTRPTDAPSWVDLNLTRSEMRRLRALAAGAKVGVDAWLAVRLEFRVTATALRRAGADVDAVVTAAAASEGIVELAPTPALRCWVQLLEGSATELPRDELPTVVLPERLVVQVPPAQLARLLTDVGLNSGDDRGLMCDLAAARNGQTMEAWMLSTALALGLRD